MLLVAERMMLVLLPREQQIFVVLESRESYFWQQSRATKLCCCSRWLNAQHPLCNLQLDFARQVAFVTRIIAPLQDSAFMEAILGGYGKE